MIMMTTIDDKIKEWSIEFQKDYAPYMGWENPFQKDVQVENEGKGKLSSNEEKNLWLYRKDSFIMRQLFKNISFQKAKEYAAASYQSALLLDDLQKMWPCYSGNNQCHFDCNDFGKCIR